MTGNLLLDAGIPWDQDRAKQLLDLVTEEAPLWRQRRRAVADAVREGLPTSMHADILRFLNLTEACLCNVDHVDSALQLLSKSETDKAAQTTLHAVVRARKLALSSWAHVDTLIQRHRRAQSKAGK